MLVIITGASKGIGFELVKKFAGTNYLVIAVSRQTKSLSKLINDSSYTNVLAVSADISTSKGINSVLTISKKLKKPLSILINNAGIIVNKPYEKISEKELKEVYSTNVFAPFLLTQKLTPLFSKKTKGHIVNISSMGGFQGSAKFAGLSAYSSSKAALSGLTECLAEELKTKNISVNCLAIGAVQTEMLSKAFPGYKAPLKANEMAEYVFDFAINGNTFYNGKILPVSSSTP